MVIWMLKLREEGRIFVCTLFSTFRRFVSYRIIRSMFSGGFLLCVTRMFFFICLLSRLWIWRFCIGIIVRFSVRISWLRWWRLCARRVIFSVGKLILVCIRVVVFCSRFRVISWCLFVIIWVSRSFSRWLGVLIVVILSFSFFMIFF